MLTGFKNRGEVFTVKDVMKREKIVIIIVSLVFSVLVFTCDNGNSENYYAETLVCFGDSLTAGYGATVPGIDDKTKSYPAYLQDRVTIPVINSGVSGDTTANALARLNRDVILKNPKIVIIELGANDFFSRIPISTTKDNLKKIIALLNNGKPKIFVAKFYTEPVVRGLANSFDITDYNAQTVIINQYDDMFDSLAGSENIELIEDIWSGVWGIHMSDAVHPNAAGYQKMADNYFNRIKIYLQTNDLTSKKYFP
jgi:acyl-CoA thioesterase-1